MIGASEVGRGEPHADGVPGGGTTCTAPTDATDGLKGAITSARKLLSKMKMHGAKVETNDRAVLAASSSTSSAGAVKLLAEQALKTISTRPV